MKVNITLIAIIFIYSTAFLSNLSAQTFTTINDGDWTNSTNVWSTDGLTPCGCSPSPDINGFDVVIRHDINMNVDINFKSSSDSVIVRSGGSLSNFNFLINVTTGFLYTESGSSVNIKELIVGPSGKCDFSGDILTQVKWSIDGTVNLSAEARVIDENLEIKSGGTVNLLPGAELILENKDLLNDGTLNIDNACVSVEQGTIENKGGASVTGTGLIQTLVGDIINSGSWSTTVDWCAAGSGSGLPIPEDCSVTCASFKFLPIELKVFDAKVYNGDVVLNWTTTSELNNDYFSVERSINGYDFQEVFKMSGAGNSSEELYYSVTDESPYIGTSYYRLKQTDFDGTTSYSTLKAVNIEYNSMTSIFPNPASDGFVNVKVSDLGNDDVIISFHNLLGSLVHSEIHSSDAGNLNTTISVEQLPAGVYMMTGKSSGNSEASIFKIKLVVE